METSKGAIYLNARSERGVGMRQVAWSFDAGETFARTQAASDLIEPPCQASALALARAGGPSDDLIMFANPASRTRDHFTVRVSRDGAQTWDAGRVLQAGPSAYNDLCQLPDGRIGCLYERGDAGPYETITWAAFDRAWLSEA